MTVIETSTPAHDFIKGEVLKIENRIFQGSLLLISVGYLLITLWLNGVRTSAPIWFVWVLIITQFALYLSIFISIYKRSIVCGLNKTFALVIFAVLFTLGRVENWEIVVIPSLVLIMLIASTVNKRVSDKGRQVLPINN